MSQPGQVSAVREPQVLREFSNLEYQLKRGEELMVQANERFSNILRPQPDKQEKVIKEEQDDLVPLAERLSRCRNALVNFNNSLEQLIGRAEKLIVACI